VNNLSSQEFYIVVSYCNKIMAFYFVTLGMCGQRGRASTSVCTPSRAVSL